MSTLIIEGIDHDSVESSDSQLIQNLSKFWETESTGITDHKTNVAKEFPPEFF